MSVRCARRLPRLLGTGVLLVLTACSPSVTVEPASAPAVRPVAEFMLVRRDADLIIVAGGSQTTLAGVLPPDTFDIDAAAVDAGHVAVRVDNQLLIIDRVGSVASAELDSSCSGLVSDGDRIAVLCDPSRRDRIVTVQVFSVDAYKAGEVPVHLRQERNSSFNGFSSEFSIDIVAAGPSHFWLEYTDRLGFTRGGSRLLARHNWDGTPDAATRLDGAVYDTEISADGRFAAFLVGGSGGACHTDAHLRVVDLAATRQLDTSPETPPEARARGMVASAVYLTGQHLRWYGDTIHLWGTTADHESGGCDTDLRYWHRSYAVGSGILIDTELSALPEQAAFAGPGCEDVLLADSWGSPPYGRTGRSCTTRPSPTNVNCHDYGRQYQRRLRHLPLVPIGALLEVCRAGQVIAAQPEPSSRY